VRSVRCCDAAESSVPLMRIKCRAGEKKKQIVATSIAPRCDMARLKNLTH
jgi:hypothetical protein